MHVKLKTVKRKKLPKYNSTKETEEIKNDKRVKLLDKNHCIFMTDSHAFIFQFFLKQKWWRIYNFKYQRSHYAMNICAI